MVPEKLKKYIVYEIKKGFSLKEIKDKLLESGYSEDVVLSAISEFEEKAKKAPGKEAPAGKPRLPKKRKLFILISSLVILLIIVFAAYLIYLKSEGDIVEDVEEITDLNQPREKVLEISSSAYSETDIEECEKLRLPENILKCKNRVYRILAYKNKDSSDCEMLDDSLGRIYEDRMHGDEDADDIQVCKTIVTFISEGRIDDLCNLWVDSQKEQSSGISEADMLLFCKGMFNLDKSFCDEISNLEKKEECNLLIGI